MAQRSLHGYGFNRQLYDETASGVISLKSQLPAEAVQSLATEVIQRVAARATTTGKPALAHPSPHQVDHLAFALMDANDVQAALDYVKVLDGSGVSVEDIYLSYLAAAARRLGEWWTENHVSFMDVVTGTTRIYSILRALDQMRPDPGVFTHKMALFASTPGETHTLGVHMAADLFRREGWDIEMATDLSHEDLMTRIDEARPAIVGLSAAGEHALVPLARLVLAIRIHCPGTLIFIGGALVSEAPNLIQNLSPDGTATSVSAALEIMDGLWDRVTAE